MYEVSVNAMRLQHADAVHGKQITWFHIFYVSHAFALSFPERRRAKNMANQSKMQLSLLDMEQRESLLIAVAHTFMQLQNVD